MIIFSKQAKVALTQLSYPDKQKSSQTYFLCYFCVSEFIIDFHKNIITMPHHFRVLLLIIVIHSNVLAWRVPGTGEPGGLPSMGSHRVIHDWSNLAVAEAYQK